MTPAILVNGAPPCIVKCERLLAREASTIPTAADSGSRAATLERGVRLFSVVEVVCAQMLPHSDESLVEGTYF